MPPPKHYIPKALHARGHSPSHPASSEFLCSAPSPLAGSVCSRDPVQPRATDPPQALRRQQFAQVIWKEEGQIDPQNKLKINSRMGPLPKRTSAIPTADAYQDARGPFSLPAALPRQKELPPSCADPHPAARTPQLSQLQPPNSHEAPGLSTMARFPNAPARPVVPPASGPHSLPHSRGKHATGIQELAWTVL